jgi:hypothetical protein
MKQDRPSSLTLEIAMIATIQQVETATRPRYRLDLTPAEHTALIRAYANELLADREKARTFLCEAGIYNEDGTLTEVYSRTNSDYVKV